MIDVGEGLNCSGDPALNDLLVRVFGNDEPDGQLLLVEQISTGSTTYRGTLAVSTRIDRPGVLFVNPHGTRMSELRATYYDADDGSGFPCSTVGVAGFEGQLEDTTTVVLPSVGAVVVRGSELQDNQDADGIPDDNETVEMRVSLTNKTGMLLTGVTARIFTRDPDIDCILVDEIDIPDLPADGTPVWSSDAFVFHVSLGADRLTLGLTRFDLHEVRFRLAVHSNEVEAIDVPQEIVYDLDLDFAGGGLPSTFFEGFEAGTFGAFSAMHLDFGRFGLAGSDGYRCTYHDPDYWPSNSFGDATCHLGVSMTHSDTFFWRLDGPLAPDGGRAFSGLQSLHFGEPGTGVAGSHTTPTGTLEAVGLVDPIYLGWDNVCDTTRHQFCVGDFDCTGAALGQACVTGSVYSQIGSKSIAGVVEDWSFSRPFDESKIVKPPEARVDESNRERRKH